MFGRLFGRKSPASRLSGEAVPSPGVDKASLAARFVQQLGPVVPGAELAIVAPLRIVASVQGRKHVIDLAPLWEEVRRDPEGKGQRALDRTVKVYADIVNAPDESPALSRENLRSVVRRRTDRKAATAIAAGSPTRLLDDEVGSMMVLDSEHAMQYLLPADLRTLGMSELECWEAATANVERMAFSVEYQANGSIGMVICGGDYESSHLFNAALWRTVEDKWGVPPVAFVPQRDILMFVRSDRDIDIARITIECLALARESASPIAVKPFLRRNGRWEPYDVEALKSRMAASVSRPSAP